VFRETLVQLKELDRDCWDLGCSERRQHRPPPTGNIPSQHEHNINARTQPPRPKSADVCALHAFDALTPLTPSRRKSAKLGGGRRIPRGGAVLLLVCERVLLAVELAHARPTQRLLPLSALAFALCAAPLPQRPHSAHSAHSARAGELSPATRHECCPPTPPQPPATLVCRARAGTRAPSGWRCKWAVPRRCRGYK
jgi:hypothetical protein